MLEVAERMDQISGESPVEFGCTLRVEDAHVSIQGRRFPLTIADLVDEKIVWTTNGAYPLGSKLFQGLYKEIRGNLRATINEADQLEHLLAGYEDVSQLEGVQFLNDTHDIAKQETQALFEEWRSRNMNVSAQELHVQSTQRVPAFALTTIKVGNVLNDDFNTSLYAADAVIKARSALQIYSGLPVEPITIFEFSDVKNYFPHYRTLYLDRLIAKLGVYGFMHSFDNKESAVFLMNKARNVNGKFQVDEDHRKEIISHEIAHTVDPYLREASLMLSEGFATAVEKDFSVNDLKKEYRTESKRPLSIKLLIDLFAGRNVGVPKERDTFFTPAFLERYFLSGAFFSAIYEQLGNEGVAQFHESMVFGVYNREKNTYFGHDDIRVVLPNMEADFKGFKAIDFVDDFIFRMNQ